MLVQTENLDGSAVKLTATMNRYLNLETGGKVIFVSRVPTPLCTWRGMLNIETMTFAPHGNKSYIKCIISQERKACDVARETKVFAPLALSIKINIDCMLSSNQGDVS